MNKPSDIAKKWLLRWNYYGEPPLDECFQEAIKEATAELRERLDIAEESWKKARLDVALLSSQNGELRTQCDGYRIRVMELDRALDTMHARADRAELRENIWKAEREQLCHKLTTFIDPRPKV